MPSASAGLVCIVAEVLGCTVQIVPILNHGGLVMHRAAENSSAAVLKLPDELQILVTEPVSELRIPVIPFMDKKAVPFHTLANAVVSSRT